jgi:hypothetical protein
MAEHNAAYFVDALRHLDWSHPWTGEELINLFNDFPIGWFVHVDPNRVFTRWEDFWECVTPISASTRGPAVHQEMAERFVPEADQRDASG